MRTASSAVSCGAIFWASAAVVISEKVIRSRIGGLDARGTQLEAVLRERCRSVGRPNITGASRELVMGERSVIRPQTFNQRTGGRLEVVPHLAEGYTREDNGFRHHDYFDRTLEIGAGGVHATVQ